MMTFCDRLARQVPGEGALSAQRVAYTDGERRKTGQEVWTGLLQLQQKVGQFTPAFLKFCIFGLRGSVIQIILSA